MCLFSCVLIIVSHYSWTHLNIQLTCVLRVAQLCSRANMIENVIEHFHEQFDYFLNETVLLIYIISLRFDTFILQI